MLASPREIVSGLHPQQRVRLNAEIRALRPDRANGRIRRPKPATRSHNRPSRPSVTALPPATRPDRGSVLASPVEEETGARSLSPACHEGGRQQHHRADRQFGHRLAPNRMVGVGRIELPTPAMSTQCSTTELYAHCRPGIGRRPFVRPATESPLEGGPRWRAEAALSGGRLTMQATSAGCSRKRRGLEIRPRMRHFGGCTDDGRPFFQIKCSPDSAGRTRAALPSPGRANGRAWTGPWPGARRGWP